jgi:hypothetical protein
MSATRELLLPLGRHVAGAEAGAGAGAGFSQQAVVVDDDCFGTVGEAEW